MARPKTRTIEHLLAVVFCVDGKMAAWRKRVPDRPDNISQGATLVAERGKKDRDKFDDVADRHSLPRKAETIRRIRSDAESALRDEAHDATVARLKAMGSKHIPSPLNTELGRLKYIAESLAGVPPAELAEKYHPKIDLIYGGPYAK